MDQDSCTCRTTCSRYKFTCSAFIIVFSIANEDREHSDDLVKKLLNFTITSLPIVYFSIYFKTHSAVFT